MQENTIQVAIVDCPEAAPLLRQAERPPGVSIRIYALTEDKDAGLADVIILGPDVTAARTRDIFAHKSPSARFVLMTDGLSMCEDDPSALAIYDEILMLDNLAILRYRLQWLVSPQKARRGVLAGTAALTSPWEAEEACRLLIDGLRDPVLLLRADFTLVAAKPAFYRQFAQHYDKQSPFSLTRFGLRCFETDLALQRQPTAQISAQRTGEAGDVHHYSIQKDVILDSEGERAGYYYNFVDISEQKAEEARLRTLSHTDELTKINNRKAIRAYFDTHYSNMLRNETPFTVIMMDLDAFKAFNDHYGHVQGDQTLASLGSVLYSIQQQESDTLVARYGGEEFILLAQHKTAEESWAIGEHIQHELAAKAIPHAKSFVSGVVTLSLGIAHYQSLAGARISTLIESADAALYEAKQKGRNRAVMHRY